MPRIAGGDLSYSRSGETNGHYISRIAGGDPSFSRSGETNGHYISRIAGGELSYSRSGETNGHYISRIAGGDPSFSRSGETKGHELHATNLAFSSVRSFPHANVQGLPPIVFCTYNYLPHLCMYLFSADLGLERPMLCFSQKV